MTLDRINLTEDEAEMLLNTIVRRESERAQMLLKPFVEELITLGFRKPPVPVVSSDGYTYEYCGPTATETLGEYKAPKWLGQMCCEDYELSQRLMEYRNKSRRQSKGE